MKTIINDNEIMITALKRPETQNHGYKYLVTLGAYSHTAFRTKKGLKRWLKDFGFKIKYHYRNDHAAFYKVEGKAEHIMCWRDEWDQINEDESSYRLSNGDYTLNKIVRGDVTKLYYLNPNVKDRPIQDYRILGGE